MGELLGNLELFPFMYRGRITNLDLATENGFYEIFGSVSNAPFSQSWAPLVVIGNYYKLQIAAYTVSDNFKLYVRQLNNSIGWKQISLI